MGIHVYDVVFNRKWLKTTTWKQLAIDFDDRAVYNPENYQSFRI